MRPMPDQRIEKMRQMALEFEMYGESPVGTANGVFGLRRRNGTVLRMIASNGEGWEHVSVSTAKRCPTWEEMCFVKDLFWLPEEAVMQLHPPQSEWVNNHPFCLHLWRPTDGAIPLPLSILVGHRDEGVLNERKARRLMGMAP